MARREAGKARRLESRARRARRAGSSKAVEGEVSANPERVRVCKSLEMKKENCAWLVWPSG